MLSRTQCDIDTGRSSNSQMDGHNLKPIVALVIFCYYNDILLIVQNVSNVIIILHPNLMLPKR